MASEQAEDSNLKKEEEVHTTMRARMQSQWRAEVVASELAKAAAIRHILLVRRCCDRCSAQAAAAAAARQAKLEGGEERDN